MMLYKKSVLYRTRKLADENDTITRANNTYIWLYRVERVEKKTPFPLSFQ